jgi:D-beta-D-heptose 7-phosphate kinase/D-beta-D-heptose 1-phosphate adenosyltransferase
MSKYYVVSGGFDPIHEGHIENIKESRLKSDGVIVLLNSDQWLCRKKKHNFMKFYTRRVILENIKGVIDVIGFDDSDDSACDGLRRAKAKYANDVLVFAKGGDRTADNIPEIDVCKKLGIEIKYNVGFSVSGNQKPNSSSWILNEYVSKCCGEQK